MRPEALYLSDIIEACDAVERFMQGIPRRKFVHDELHQSAVLQKLLVIGEAAARLPIDFKKLHSEIEWADIVGFRNIAIHEYFSVDWSIVWVTATQDIPRLRQQVSSILTSYE